MQFLNPDGILQPGDGQEEGRWGGGGSRPWEALSSEQEVSLGEHGELTMSLIFKEFS